MSFGEIQTRWARLLIESLVQSGIRRAVISPGSRSTPFVAAAIDHPDLECRWIIDERSAAFFAVAQAKVTGDPSLLICTSGSALGNYFPAVVEASQSFTPLLVLSCDRPFELIECGANQTIDQHGIFGDFARAFFELGEATARPRSIAALQRRAVQAVHLTGFPIPGVVHLNARALKPLEPLPVSEEGEKTGKMSNRPRLRVDSPVIVASAAGVTALAALVKEYERGLIVCGPAPIRQRELRPLLEALAEVLGYPICADAASQLRFRGHPSPNHLDSFSVGIGSATFRQKVRPDVILQVGRQPTSSGWEVFLEESSVAQHWTLAEHGWNDAEGRVSRMVNGDLSLLIQDLLGELEGFSRESVWSTQLAGLEKVIQGAIDGVLNNADTLTEGSVVRSVVEELPWGGLLAVGNSLPIRDVDAFCRGSLNELAVWSQRGASGIDGLVAGAAGAASVFAGPSALLIGDVSFLHDLSGSSCLREVRSPLAVVVIQNGGGRIFDFLPIAATFEFGSPESQFWSTPMIADMEGIAILHGFPFVRASSRRALVEEYREAVARPGVSLIEAIVPPRSVGRERKLVNEAIEESLR